MTKFIITASVILLNIFLESSYAQNSENLFSSEKYSSLKSKISMNEKTTDEKVYDGYFTDKFNSKRFTRKTKISESLQLLAVLAGSYLHPLNDLAGDLSSVSLVNGATSSRSYFEKWGYNYGVEIKFPVTNKDNLRIIFSMFLNNFFNSGNDSSGYYIIEPRLKSIQTGLGLEYVFPIQKKFRALIYGGITNNIFYGSIDFYTNSMSFVNSLTYNPNTRFGIEGGIGLEYAAIKKLGVVAGLKYNLANLIGKDYDQTGAHDLNDESFTINGTSISRKTISFLRVYLGLVLYYFD